MKVFERFGAVGHARRNRDLQGLRIGDAHASHDADDGMTWEAHKTSEALFRLWGPKPSSDWSAYHRPTLFAALDSVKTPPYPVAPPLLDPRNPPRSPPPWAGPGRAVLLDLPAELSVAYAALLARNAGYQPVVTFNNWPHPLGLVDMARPLGGLLYWAPWILGAKERADDTAPPVFVLDSNRFGFRKPRPRDFDNRYFLMESDLPSGPVLKRNGITQVVYVRLAPGTPVEAPPGPPGPVQRFGAQEVEELQKMAKTLGMNVDVQKELLQNVQILPSRGDPRVVPEFEEDDLNVYLHELPRHVGLQLARVGHTLWSTDAPRDFRPAPRKTVFSTVRDPAFAGFRRSAAGGFGELVPVPGSGG